jgi:hypothetical protein
LAPTTDAPESESAAVRDASIVRIVIALAFTRMHKEIFFTHKLKTKLKKNNVIFFA